MKPKNIKKEIARSRLILNESRFLAVELVEVRHVRRKLKAKFRFLTKVGGGDRLIAVGGFVGPQNGLWKNVGVDLHEVSKNELCECVSVCIGGKASDEVTMTTGYALATANGKEWTRLCLSEAVTVESWIAGQEECGAEAGVLAVAEVM